MRETKEPKSPGLSSIKSLAFLKAFFYSVPWLIPGFHCNLPGGLRGGGLGFWLPLVWPTFELASPPVLTSGPKRLLARS